MTSIVGSFLDQFVPALAADLIATVIGGGLLAWVGYRLIEKRLRKNARTDALRIAHDELQGIASDIEVFTKMIKRGDVPYGRFAAVGWETISKGGGLEGIASATSHALITVYDKAREMNAKLDKFAEMKLGTMVVVMQATEAATRRWWGVRPAVGRLANRYDGMVAEHQKNMLLRLPELRKVVDCAVREIEGEPDYRPHPPASR